MLNFIDNIKVAIKLPAAIALIGVTIASVVAFVSFQDARHSLLEVSEASLSANVEVKQAGLQNWLLEIQDDLLVQSQNPSVISAVQDFSDAWLQIEGDPQSRLQTLYITDNPHPTGSKENLDAAPDGSIYSATHARYHPYFRELQRRNEYYDVFLFDTNGNLVYSVFKELDYATNLVNGKWADTDLGGAFRAARDNKVSGDPSFFDFRPYGPSYDAPASFISIPLTGTEGNFVGVLAYQMPVGRLNALMGDRGGLGESGQAYIVGTDGMFRSDLPLTDGDDILVESPVKKDFGSLSSEETTLLVTTGVSGQRVVVASKLMEFMGTRWAFSAEQDFSELVAPARELRNALILQIFVGAVLIALIGWLLSRYFTKPLIALQGSIERISADDLEGAVPGTNRRDELGAIANSLDGLKTSLEKSKAMERNQEQVVITLSKSLGDLATGDLASRINRDMPEEYRGLKDSFNRTVDALASSFKAVSENAIKVRSSSKQINKSAEALSQRTENQAATLEETAAALEQLAASVSSTADGAKQADELARSTHDNAEASRIVMDKAVSSIQGIEASTGQISQVVGIINDIAFQTNLLALNAGVEAARAGDAGRGFAVVATEVRQLAQRCADSANEIAQLVEKSKMDVGSGVENVTEAVEAIQGVLGSVKEISTSVANISVATQEQSSGLGEINSAVSQLDQVTQQNAAMVEETKAASDALSTESDQLDRQVQKFNLGSNSASRPSSDVNSTHPDTNSIQKAQAQMIQTTNLKPTAPSNDAWEEF